MSVRLPHPPAIHAPINPAEHWRWTWNSAGTKKSAGRSKKSSHTFAKNSNSSRLVTLFDHAFVSPYHTSIRSPVVRSAHRSVGQRSTHTSAAQAYGELQKRQFNLQEELDHMHPDDERRAHVQKALAQADAKMQAIEDAGLSEEED